MKAIMLILVFLICYSHLSSDEYNDLREQSDAITVTYYHDILKSFSGTYRQIYFFSPPESKPESGTGKSVNSIILNERYLEINSTLDFKKDKVTKRIIIGYDGISKEYQLTEYSNIETYPLIASGIFIPEQKAIIFEGKYPHSILNNNKFKIIIKFDATGEFTYSFFEIESGIENKILEIKNYKLD